MPCITDDSCKSLASLALFRELYDKKQDLCGVLSEFLKHVIICNGQDGFDLTTITNLLNNSFHFKIPPAIVKTTLKNRLSDMVEKKYGSYYLKGRQIKNVPDNFDDRLTSFQNNNEILIDNLFDYIQTSNKKELTDVNKEDIVQSLCTYLLDEGIVDIYTEYISAFIIKNNANAEFIENLRKIKEGVLLYTGLQYNTNAINLNEWNTNLVIFLDTEILFFLAGYNGQIYKSLCDDLLACISEINRKKKKNLIVLKYFEEIRNECESFFKKAEDIVRGADTLREDKRAMRLIVNGCSAPSDVIEKKTLFYVTLQKHDITLDSTPNYNNQSNYFYNLEDASLIKPLSDSLKQSNIVAEDEEILSTLRLLNKVNILRKGNNQTSFENAGYIFLTGKHITRAIARDKNIKQNGNIPLATDIYYLTEKLWFKLNKGFGNDDRSYPKSFDVIVKAQMILASQLNVSMSTYYEKKKEEFRRGELKQENIVAIIHTLRSELRFPEDINSDDVNDVLEMVVNEDLIENYVNEKAYYKDKASDQEKTINALSIKLNDKDEDIERKSALIKEHEAYIARIKKEKEEEENKKTKRKQLIVKIIAAIIAIVFIGIGIYLYLLGYFSSAVIITLIGFIASILQMLSYFGYEWSALRKKSKIFGIGLISKYKTKR